MGQDSYQGRSRRGVVRFRSEILACSAGQSVNRQGHGIKKGGAIGPAFCHGMSSGLHLVALLAVALGAESVLAVVAGAARMTFFHLRHGCRRVRTGLEGRRDHYDHLRPPAAAPAVRP